MVTYDPWKIIGFQVKKETLEIEWYLKYLTNGYEKIIDQSELTSDTNNWFVSTLMCLCYSCIREDKSLEKPNNQRSHWYLATELWLPSKTNFPTRIFPTTSSWFPIWKLFEIYKVLFKYILINIMNMVKQIHGN